jgi:sulfate adenylyltransferase
MEISLRTDQYLELENLGNEVFLPVINFMTEDDFKSVCDNMTLTNGSTFTIPILLDVDINVVKNIHSLDPINLFYEGVLVGSITPESIFQFDKKKICNKIFGTDNLSHPGVNRFLNLKDWFIGGETKFFNKSITEVNYKLSPKDTKDYFNKMGWKTIVGFQTRNVPHRAHEYLQRVALEFVDGLFIQPLIGQKKIGDYTESSIINGYNALINNFYPSNRVLLGTLTTAMRYAGPREAVFHAIIRKNYGCTHFIVGRDHAGVGNFYEKYEAHNLLKTVEKNIGIKIFYMFGPFYCEKCESIATEKTCKHDNENSITEISGTFMRNILTQGQIPDNRFFRKEVFESLDRNNLFIK